MSPRQRSLESILDEIDSKHRDEPDIRARDAGPRSLEEIELTGDTFALFGDELE